MHPQNHRSQSARPRGRNSTPWGVVPVETLLDPKEEPSKSEDDHSVGSRKKKKKKKKKKKRGSNQERCSTPPCRVSKRVKKKPTRYRLEEEEDVETEFPGCVDPKNRGKRSVRPRGNKPAASTSWAMSLDRFQNLGTAASNKPRSVGSERMKSNCTDEQIGVADSASLDTKGSNHGGHIIAAAEIKVSNGTFANSVVHASVPATDTLPDLKKINGPFLDGLARTAAIQANNDFVALKDRANDAAEFDSKPISGLVLDNGNVQFDLSSAESALASLYGDSDRDMCIEFAVKLLMNETPLPKEAAEIEEFFTQKIQGGVSTKKQWQEEPSNSCYVWGNLQSDKLLLSSRC